MNPTSIRYGQTHADRFDPRSAFLRLCGALQGKKTVILKSNPELCGEILAASDRKGTFIEHLIATPAWDPIYSTESVDGELWKSLAQDFRKVITKIRWRERLTPIIDKHIDLLVQKTHLEPQSQIDSEAITKLTLRMMFELLFETEITQEDETLFYQASVEWRKEIGMKGRANPEIKKAFWDRLNKIVDTSKFKENLQLNQEDPGRWLSVFAQPFLISPQINFSDIMVAVFHFLRTQPKKMEDARRWAAENDRARLGGIILESIRLRHPFPILERELPRDTALQGQTFKAHTQFFLLFDQLQQDQDFIPERWLQSPTDNPYHAIPFGTGPRMCAGKPIAMDLLVEMLKAFVSRFPDEKIQPQVGHLYSGRDNDTSPTLPETLYQIKTTLSGIWTSLRIGRQKKSTPGTCPWKKLYGG